MATSWSQVTATIRPWTFRIKYFFIKFVERIDCQFDLNISPTNPLRGLCSFHVQLNLITFDMNSGILSDTKTLALVWLWKSKQGTQNTDPLPSEKTYAFHPMYIVILSYMYLSYLISRLLIVPVCCVFELQRTYFRTFTFTSTLPGPQLRTKCTPLNCLHRS